MPILLNGFGVMALTWGAVALEFALFAGLTMDRRYRPFLLALGLLFHLGIAVIHGLVAFFLAMAAALILYLRPVDQPFAWPDWLAAVGREPDPGVRRLLWPRLRWATSPRPRRP